jgi:hydrogenase 3 maturation protease
LKPHRAWLNSLARTLARLQPPDRPPRVAVVGMGHELRGDDAAGVAVAQALQSRLAGLQTCEVFTPLRFASEAFRKTPQVSATPPVIVIDAGPAVENFTGPLRRFGPDLVLLIDAAQMDEAPGAVRWLAWQETDGLSASTHTLPPRVLAQYLTSELGCEVALVGVQPADTTMGAPLSQAAQAAVHAVAQALAEMLGV